MRTNLENSVTYSVFLLDNESSPVIYQEWSIYSQVWSPLMTFRLEMERVYSILKKSR